MKQAIRCLIFIILLSSCGIESKNCPYDLDALSFDTTEDAVMWFKNVRQLNYRHEEVSAAKTDLFWKGNRGEGDKHLVFLIARQRTSDKAFIMIEAYGPEGLLNNPSMSVGDWTVALGSMNAAEQTLLAIQLSNRLCKGEVPSIDGQQMDAESIEHMRLTVIDYLQMVNYW